jgi:sigma-E factor negative regulatory protein RseC
MNCGQGQILEIQGEQVTILGKDASEACFGCMNLECKGHKHIFAAENPRGLSLEKGRFVEVEIPPSRRAAEAGTALLIPILAFPAGYFLFPLPSPGLKTGAGFFALVLAALAVFVAKKFFPPRALPRIVRVLGPNEPPAAGL